MLKAVAKFPKMTPWWALAFGVLWLLLGTYDALGLHFLSHNPTAHHDEVLQNFRAWMDFAIAALYLFAACRNFMRMRTPSAQ